MARDEQETEDFFDAAGPFEIRRTEKLITGAQKELWAEADEYDEGLSRAIGCYLFALKHGETLTPWYVGMTVAESGFRGEVFQQHKRDIYNEVLELRKGSPMMILFPLWTPALRFSKAYSSAKPKIQWLEKTLMGMAYSQNPEISNVRDMTILRRIAVSGVLGRVRQGRPTTGATAAKKALVG